MSLKTSIAVALALLPAATIFARQPVGAPDLDPVQVKQAITILRRDSLRGPGLDEPAIERATLQGLMDMMGPGAEVVREGKPASKVSPFRSEVFEDNTGYIRMGALNTENVAQLDAALQDFATKKVDGIVIDLRATPETQDYVLAAQAATRFAPAKTKMFSIVKSGDTAPHDFVSDAAPTFDGIIMVVADGETAGAAEALASVLRTKADATIVGSRTSGRAVEFAEVPLGGGKILRYAASEVKVDGAPALYPDGIAPDLEITQSSEDRKAVLDGALAKGATPFVFEKEQPHMNEAALVSGTNPEIDESAGEPAVAPLIDRPLQRAVDLVTAMRVFRKKN